MTRTPFDEMERMFDGMRRSMFDTRETNVGLEPTDGGYLVHADLPGFETEELDLRFDDGVLTIAGTHEVSGEDVSRARRVHERMTVPGEVRVDEIEATYRNGVLEIVLPVEDDHDEKRRIDIE